MKAKRLFLSVLLITVITTAYGQNVNDSILTVTTMLGVVYRQNDKDLSVKNLMDITRSNPDAFREMKTARNNYITAGALAATGSVLIIWPVMTQTPNGHFNWISMAVGAGVYLVALPCVFSYKKHVEKAVNIYNTGKVRSVPKPVTYNLGLYGCGLGLRINF